MNNKITWAAIALIVILGGWFMITNNGGPKLPESIVDENGNVKIENVRNDVQMGENGIKVEAKIDAENASLSPSEMSSNINEKITQNMSEKTHAILVTNKGEIEIEFFTQDAPATVANFIKLSEENFYDGVKFHRIIDNFMIQGGDPLTKDDTKKDWWGTGGPGYKFNDEIHLNNRNVKGSIAMANAGPNTNGSQFFINVADNNFLDTRHTVFGKVVRGMEVVNDIKDTPTDEKDRPVEPIIINDVLLK